MLQRIVKTILPEPPSLFYLARQQRLVRRFIEEAGGQPVLNLGAGAGLCAPNVVNLDIRPKRGVHLVADARLLPFRDASFGFVLCESLLEHVLRPEQAVSEIRRVLAPGGRFLAIVSFMTPFHAEPRTREDYQRWTLEGLRHLFCDFAELELGPLVGPASAFCLHAQFFLASLLGLGDGRLFYFWMRLLGWLLWPIKHLDRWLLSRANADTAATDLFCTGRKPDQPMA